MVTLPDRVRRVVAEAYDVPLDHVRNDALLIEHLNGDDLCIVELAFEIEIEFGVGVTPDDAEDFRTVADVVAFVEAAMLEAAHG